MEAVIAPYTVLTLEDLFFFQANFFHTKCTNRSAKTTKFIIEK